MLDTREIALARQPIFDRGNQLVGYELLYRQNSSHDAATAPNGGGPARMSGDTIVGAVLTIGLRRVTHGRPAFVNVDRATLLNDSIYVFDPSDVVVELLESTPCDREVIAACEALVERGYALALDDFVYEPAYEPLLRIASIVKLDVLGKTAAELRPQLDRLRPFGVRCLAERVETNEMRAECAAIGFDLFQGYFFARPETLGGQELPVEHTGLIRLLNVLRDPAKTDRELEEVFRADVALTYKLLRIVNSAAAGQSGITSIGHGIRLLGRSALHRWMALLLVSSFAGADADARGELVEMAMVRARFCELLSECLGRKGESGASFMAGLFSMLDALTHVSMSDLLEQIELMPELRQALLTREGPYAAALRLAESYESASWLDVFASGESLGVPLDDLPELYVRAVEWARACRHGAPSSAVG